MKYAIRIVSVDSGFTERSLFAVVPEEYVTKYRQMAKQSIPSGSSSWIQSEEWKLPPYQWYCDTHGMATPEMHSNNYDLASGRNCVNEMTMEEYHTCISFDAGNLF